MRAIEASTEADVIGAGLADLHPDKTLHFHYTSGPQSVAKVL
jgi:hypothetical protein